MSSLETSKDSTLHLLNLIQDTAWQYDEVLLPNQSWEIHQTPDKIYQVPG